jgi:hypothetical protein
VLILLPNVDPDKIGRIYTPTTCPDGLNTSELWSSSPFHHGLSRLATAGLDQSVRNAATAGIYAESEIETQRDSHPRMKAGGCNEGSGSTCHRLGGRRSRP